MALTTKRSTMVCFPNAKINIGLNIIEKREDGFHNIESVFYPVGLCDVLEVVESSKLKVGSLKSEVKRFDFNSSGIKIPGKIEDNLCSKAYNLISKDYPLPPVNVHLHKIIPIGAGLGGGSADAAFFIKLLNEKFNLGLSWGEMHHYAKQLGSDCSFFIGNKPAFVKGRGDDMESIRLDLSEYSITLVYPNIHLFTAEAYAGVKPKKPKENLQELIRLPVDQWKNNIHNDFEDSLFPEYPELKKIKEQLYSQGAIYSSLSGSGSTLYGIFRKKQHTQKKISEKYVVWEI